MEKELEFDIKKISPREQEELRKKIVREMKKRDGDIKEVSEICECSVRHVYSTWKKYQEGGINAIKSVKMGRPVGTGCRLKRKQESKIKKILREKRPNEVGLSGYLWDRKAVSELVKQKCKVILPLSTVGDYLAKWNYTSQRPKKTLQAGRE
jgi:transposase